MLPTTRTQRHFAKSHLCLATGPSIRGAAWALSSLSRAHQLDLPSAERGTLLLALLLEDPELPNT